MAPYLLSPVRPPRLECVTSAAWPLLTLQGHDVTLLSGSQTPDTPGTDSMPSARAALLARAKCRVPFPARYSPLTAQHAVSWENHAAVSPVPLDFFPLFVSSLSGLSNCVVLGFRTVRPQLHSLRAVRLQEGHLHSLCLDLLICKVTPSPRGLRGSNEIMRGSKVPAGTSRLLCGCLLPLVTTLSSSRVQSLAGEPLSDSREGPARESPPPGSLP